MLSLIVLLELGLLWLPRLHTNQGSFGVSTRLHQMVCAGALLLVVPLGSQLLSVALLLLI